MALRRTVLTGTAGLAIVVAAVAGCSSSSSSSSSSAAEPNRPAPSVPASSAPPTASPSVAPGSASSAAANPGATTAGGPPACATADLGAAQGAAGSVYQVIDFTNAGTSSCSLYGYPGVALVGGSPLAEIGAAASRTTTSAPTLVTLGAGDTANALLRITQAGNYPTSTCDPVASTYLQIYPPNQTTPIYLAYKSTGCSATSVNLLSVSVVQAGAGSSS
jgi:Protein of unknown function (DUF4232)